MTEKDANVMKLRLVVTLEVDSAAWAREYGLAPHEVRDDVISYFDTQLQGLHVVQIEAVRTVDVR